jgi:hypothetical protein
MPQQHSPKGPIKAKPGSDPIGAVDPIRPRCRATSKGSGQPCRYPPIPGGFVCRFHGGGAPQVKAKAQERLLAIQMPAIARLAELVAQVEYPSTAMAAVKDVLDRTMGRPVESLELTGANQGPVEIRFSWQK